MAELFPRTPELPLETRRLIGCAVLDFINRTVDFRYIMTTKNPLTAGRPVDPALIEQEIGQSLAEIQNTLASIGGLPATLDDEFGTHGVILYEWLGSNTSDPAQYLWKGIITGASHPANGKPVELALSTSELYNELANQR